MRPELHAVYTLLQRGEAAAALHAADALGELPPEEAARVHAWRGQALAALGR